MKNHSLSKTIALSLGVLVMSLLISFVVLAWTGPDSPPPLGNVADLIKMSLGIPQIDISINPSIWIKDTGGGDLIRLETGEGVKFRVENTGKTIIGGEMNMSENRITNISLPLNSGDVASREFLIDYVDAAAGEAGDVSSWWGTGEDGDVTITTDTSVGTEVKFYNNLIVNSGVRLFSDKEALFIFVKDTLTLNGIIELESTIAGGDGGLYIDSGRGGKSAGVLILFAQNITGSGYVKANGKNGGRGNSRGGTRPPDQISGNHGKSAMLDGYDYIFSEGGMSRLGGKAGDPILAAFPILAKHVYSSSLIGLPILNGLGGSGGGGASGVRTNSNSCSYVYGGGGGGGGSSGGKGGQGGGGAAKSGCNATAGQGGGGGGSGGIIFIGSKNVSSLNVEAVGGLGGTGGSGTARGGDGGGGGGGMVIVVGNTDIDYMVTGGTGGTGGEDGRYFFFDITSSFFSP